MTDRVERLALCETCRDRHHIFCKNRHDHIRTQQEGACEDPAGGHGSPAAQAKTPLVTYCYATAR
jgi:hypothetical protein